MFVCLLVAAMALVAPMAEAQLGGLIGGLLGLIKIQDALVQLQCGGNVVSTTNESGIFSILLDPLQFLLPSLLNNCSIAVKTPLSNCNSLLPSVGGLVSSS
ncbi:hypothetical protein CRYUN_Cryun10bG0015100 [Craigia yunnanensis]